MPPMSRRPAQPRPRPRARGIVLALPLCLALGAAPSPPDKPGPQSDATNSPTANPGRNVVSAATGLADRWDPKTGENVRWAAELGSETYGGPVVAGGKVFVG